MQKMIALMAWIKKYLLPFLFYLGWATGLGSLIYGLGNLILGSLSYPNLLIASIGVFILLCYEVYYIEKAAKEVLERS